MKYSDQVETPTSQLAATARTALVQAAEEFADAQDLSLVITRDEPPRFYVDGIPLAIQLHKQEQL